MSSRESLGIIVDTVVEMSQNGFRDTLVPEAISALHTKDSRAISHLNEKVFSVVALDTFYPFAVAIWISDNLDRSLTLSNAVEKFKTLGVDGTESAEILSHLQKHFPETVNEELASIQSAITEVRSAKGKEADSAIAKVRNITSIPRHLMNCLLVSNVLGVNNKLVKYKYFSTLLKVLDDIQTFFIDGHPVADAGRIEKYGSEEATLSEITFSQGMAMSADRGAALLVQKYLTYSRIESILESPSENSKKLLEKRVRSLQPVTSSYDPTKPNSSKMAALMKFHKIG